jgi:protein subunit release factor A
MDAVLVEIRSGEGGEDAKRLVEDVLVTYLKAGARRGL